MHDGNGNIVGHNTYNDSFTKQSTAVEIMLFVCLLTQKSIRKENERTLQKVNFHCTLFNTNPSRRSLGHIGASVLRNKLDITI